MQNLISLNLPAQDLADIDNALATLRRCFAPMIALQPAQRRELYKMGDKSETFCRQTLAVLAANPQIVPPSLDLAEAQADLAALDQLRPRLMQLQQLVERADDTCLAWAFRRVRSLATRRAAGRAWASRRAPSGKSRALTMSMISSAVRERGMAGSPRWAMRCGQAGVAWEATSSHGVRHADVVWRGVVRRDVVRRWRGAAANA